MTLPPPGALSGLRVLDMSRVLAGPWAAQILGDLGADVIKLERPGDGDETRQWGPPFFDEAAGLSAYFLTANRNKRSIAIDLNNPGGAALARRLAAQCDVLIENHKAGALARRGLGYESLRPKNRGLIYCSLTGFGHSGPWAARPGYDAIIQAMGGLMSITGDADGTPMKVGVALADIMTGLYAATGILAALAHRQTSGCGQWLDMALFDVQAAALANQAMNYLVSGQSPGRLGSAHPNIVPYQPFAAADGRLMLAVGNDAQFERLCKVCARPDLAIKYPTNQSRVRGRDVLLPQLAAAFSTRPRDWWLQQLAAAEVPAAAINSIAEVFAEPQAQARHLQRTIPLSDGRETPTVASPLRLSATPPTYRRPPPTSGEHTREILATWLQMTEDDINALFHAQAIA